LDVLPPWPYYQIFIEILGIVFVLLFYNPYAIRDLFKRKPSSGNTRPVTSK
jgi:uncharacterized membrane protein YwaF